MRCDWCDRKEGDRQEAKQNYNLSPCCCECRAAKEVETCGTCSRSYHIYATDSKGRKEERSCCPHCVAEDTNYRKGEMRLGQRDLSKANPLRCEKALQMLNKVKREAVKKHKGLTGEYDDNLHTWMMVFLVEVVFRFTDPSDADTDKLGRVVPDGRFAAWCKKGLEQVVRDYVKDATKKRTATEKGKRPGVVLASALKDRDPFPCGAPAKELASEMWETACERIAELDKESRKLIQMHFGVGDYEDTHSYREIANELGWGEATVKRELPRILAKLRGDTDD